MKKKRKLKKSIKYLLILLIISIMSIGTFTYYNSPTTYLKGIGYKDKTIKVFKEKELIDKVKEYKYSSTLEKTIESNNFNIKYLYEYLKIDYINKDDFINNINKLLDIGYSSDTINLIYKKLNDNNINIVINKEYIKELNNYLSVNYFKEEYLEKYLNYNNKDNLDIETIITYVNIGLDNEFYTNVKIIEKPNDLNILVNKYNKLDKDYEPNDLEKIDSKYSYGEKKLRKEAKINFELMCKDAEKEGIYLKAGSTYRSYSYQENLYNRYVKRDGKKEADTYSARAGYSEHQTGLAIDIMNNKEIYIDETETKNEYIWLVNNSYKYGYILRYPKEKEHITGYMFEDWHFRYFGEPLATELYNSKLTYEEYLAKKENI